jgi:hypoxanthine phosphoribosyltransferase
MSLHVTWDQYNTLVERLALAVHDSGFRFNQIICIARGGMRVGDVLSRIYGSRWRFSRRTRTARKAARCAASS